MSTSKIGMLVGLKDPRGLKRIERALKRGNGAKAAAEELGISRVTLYKWGEAWPAVGKLIKRHALSRAEVSSLGGSQTAENRKG